MLFLALDAGNSSVKGGLWDGHWLSVERWDSTDLGGWTERFRSLGDLEGIGIASVVPDLTDLLAEAAAANRPDSDSRLGTASPPLPPRVQDARNTRRRPVGGGRRSLLPRRWACRHRPRRRDGNHDRGPHVEPAYLGGAILPGPDLLRWSLARGTSQLPDVPWPDDVVPIGASTVEAIQSGLGVLVLEGVSGLLDRTLDVLDDGALVIATGGWAPWLAERTPRIDRVEPFLVLEGVRLLTAQSRSRSD